MKGNTADLTLSGGHFVINSGSNHIHLTGTNIDLSKNAPADELRFAFSLINSIRFQKTLDDKSPYKLKSYTKSENGVEYSVVEQKDRIMYYFKDTEIIGRLSGACVETLDGDESNFFYKVFFSKIYGFYGIGSVLILSDIITLFI